MFSKIFIIIIYIDLILNSLNEKIKVSKYPFMIDNLFLLLIPPIGIIEMI